MTKKEIADLFIKLCKISSPTQKEKEIADYLEKFMEDLGWKTWRDNAWKKTGSNTGNLYAFLDVKKKKTVAFSAHMDTVQGPKEKVNVKFDGKTFKSDQTTILGADDRAGIIALLALAKNVRKEKLNTNLLFFFPTTEEAGKMGSAFFDPKSLKVDYVFNIDIGGNPGTFIYQGLAFQDFSIKLKGKAAHAAMAYEEGRDANLAAAKLITKLPVGKNAKLETTFNIGRIEGGSKNNVVSDSALIKGEYRAFDEKNMTKQELLILKACKDIEKQTGVKTEFVKEKGSVPPMEGKKDSEIVRMAIKAAKACGLKVSVEKSFTSSDANNYSGLGFETVSVARGGKNAHGKNEEIDLIQILKTIELLENIIYLNPR